MLFYVKREELLLRDIMATCRICGLEDETLPPESSEWTEWECDYCVKDELDGVTGCYSPSEKASVHLGVKLGSREIR